MPAETAHVIDVTHSEFEERVLAESARRPVVLELWSTWCSACKALMPVLERVVGSYDGRVLLAKVNVDHEGAIASAFGVRAVPTVKVLRDRRVAGEFTGAVGEGEIRRILDPVVQSAAQSVADDAASTAGHDRYAETRITLREAFEGVKRSLRLEREVACNACHGSGTHAGGTCGECGGRGAVRGHATVAVTIPEGIEDGQVLRLAGQGTAGGPGGSAGDLLLTVHIDSHPELERRGRDLHARASVPLTTALLGGKVKVPTIKGSALLAVPAGTQPGDVLRMSGQGIGGRGASPGDELVEIQVELPRSLSDKARGAIEELRDELGT